MRWRISQFPHSLSSEPPHSRNIPIQTPILSIQISNSPFSIYTFPMVRIATLAFLSMSSVCLLAITTALFPDVYVRGDPLTCPPFIFMHYSSLRPLLCAVYVANRRTQIVLIILTTNNKSERGSHCVVYIYTGRWGSYIVRINRNKKQLRGSGKQMQKF